MSHQHLIVIIDDSWPDNQSIGDLGIIDYASIRKITEGEMDWKELGLKRFIKTLVKRASVIVNVEIVGFYRIEHYLMAIENNEIGVPNILVIDWDFGKGECDKASDYLPKILARKDGLDNIYIFSRTENMSDITECLILPDMLVPGVSIYLYDKGKKENQQGATMEKLIDRALRKVENVDGKYFWYKETELKFFVSKYLDHYLDFWKIIAVAGETLVFSVLKKNDLTINEVSINNIFEQITKIFFIDEKQQYLLFNSSPKFEEQLGKLTEVTAIEALKNYGLSNIEKAVERSIIRLK